MRLHTETAGEGPPLVLLHGWGLNLRVFDGLAAELQREHRVVRIDLPGHGRSAFDATRRSFTTQVQAVLECLPPRAVIVGWSLGGQFALALAHAARGIVLIASTPRFVASEDWSAGMKPRFLEDFAARLGADWRAVLDEFLALQVRGSRDAAASLATLRAALEAQGLPDPRALADGLDLLRDNDLRADVPRIDAPVLLISGQHDRVTPPAASAWLASALPRAEHVELPRAGHAPFLSHPAETAAALGAFLQRLAA